MAFALQQVHAIKAKALDFDNGVGRFRGGLGDGWVDEEGGCRAGAIFDIWDSEN